MVTEAPNRPVLVDLQSSLQVVSGHRSILSFSPQTNTFQCVLATDGGFSFVIFLYDEIQWAAADPRIAIGSGGGGISPGSASGSGNGTSSNATSEVVPAQIGFNAGDEMRFLTLPGSRTEAVLNISSTSNVGEPGLWIFGVGFDEVISGGKCQPCRHTFPHSCS